jgi:uncharacterized protein UPF0236
MLDTDLQVPMSPNASYGKPRAEVLPRQHVAPH